MADKLLFYMVLGIRYQLHAELDAFMGVVLSLCLWNTNLNVEKIAYKVSIWYWIFYNQLKVMD